MGSIYRLLRERIALLDYPPGTLLSENRLAREFGVSRTPIRRVLHRLEFDGLVSVERGVGTLVTSVDVRYLKQVYDLRLALTHVIAELDPSLVSQDEIERLRQLLTSTRTLAGTGDASGLARAYLYFNETVTRAIGNEPLREIADRLFYLTQRTWLEALPALDWDHEVETVCNEIEATADALEQGDMRAVADVRRHYMIDCIHRVGTYLGTFDATSEPS
ncbi:MAG: GntR family transcriptional regulator [Trueperaceae bacterium]|nr:GntR family transcriptional regulator [Trueperaceae bacterium]